MEELGIKDKGFYPDKEKMWLLLAKANSLLWSKLMDAFKIITSFRFLYLGVTLRSLD